MTSSTPTRITTVALVTIALVLCFVAPGSAQQPKEPITTKKAAGIGALLGLALGGSVWDVAGGAALGAAGGMIAQEVSAGNQRKQEVAAREADAARREQDVVSREARIDALEKEMYEGVQAAEEAEGAVVAAIGEDNWNGYKALRACQHSRAFALAQAGATSQHPDHRLASRWLEAMTAVDAKDSAKATGYYEALASLDPDVDTVQQASLATDQAVLEMRAERRELGIPPCN